MSLDPLAVRDVVVMTATFVLSIGVYYVWRTARNERQGKQIRDLRERLVALEELNKILLKQVTELQGEMAQVRQENDRLRAALGEFYGGSDLDRKIRQAYGND